MLVITAGLSLSAGLVDIKQVDVAGVAIGGILAFAYFSALSLLISRTFVNTGNLGTAAKAGAKIGVILLLLTLGLTTITIAVILSHICRPLGFLVGFSALFGSIALETVTFLVFSKPQAKTKPED